MSFRVVSSFFSYTPSYRKLTTTLHPRYVPTTLLLSITHLTFFFRLDDFTNRVMVSLTALMVMSTLFLQTNQAMPRTAYLKVTTYSLPSLIPLLFSTAFMFSFLFSFISFYSSLFLF